MRKIVVLPDPLGPRSPMISPESTASDTRSTARRRPYHFVSCSAAMTEAIKAILPARRSGRYHPPRPCSYIRSACADGLLELLWIVALRRLGGRAIEVVCGHEAGVLAALQDPNVLVGIQDTCREVGQRDVREQVLCHVLREVDVIAGEHDRARLRQTHDHHLTARCVTRPALDDHALVSEHVHVGVELIHLELVR